MGGGVLAGLREMQSGTELGLKTKCGLSMRGWLRWWAEQRGPEVLSCERLEMAGVDGVRVGASPQASPPLPGLA